MKLSIMKTTLLAGAAGLAMAGGASALTFDEIPGSSATNNALSALGLDNPLKGWYGAELALFGNNVTVTATFLGSEAGNTNDFNFGGSSFTTGGGTGGTGTWTIDNTAGGGLADFAVTNLSTGSLNFSFDTSGGGGLSVANGSNPDNTVPVSNPGVNFFASFVDDQTASSGQGVYLFFDDDGASNDDNHDDMVVRLDIADGKITVVPLPAAGWLMIAGLGGLAALRRKRKAS